MGTAGSGPTLPRRARPAQVHSPAVLVLADAASKMTIGLLITFGGIGLIVNGLIVYIVVQVMGERAENRAMRGRRLGDE
jgi:hypothetical protein